jgi:TonB-dependent SusC/RagA subfamily outer membrane receptor
VPFYVADRRVLHAGHTAHPEAIMRRSSRLLRLVPLIPLVTQLAACHLGRYVPPPADNRVSVGYGERTREGVTGASVTISEAEMDAMRTTTIENVLRQHVPGLILLRDENGEIRLQIRGRSTVSGIREPHVVIDGRPATTRDLLHLTPLDVHRVTVLKDGSAAIYGLLGGNGVILVTTRRWRPAN